MLMFKFYNWFYDKTCDAQVDICKHGERFQHWMTSIRKPSVITAIVSLIVGWFFGTFNLVNFAFVCFTISIFCWVIGFVAEKISYPAYTFTHIFSYGSKCGLLRIVLALPLFLGFLYLIFFVFMLYFFKVGLNQWLFLMVISYAVYVIFHAFVMATANTLVAATLNGTVAALFSLLMLFKNFMLTLLAPALNDCSYILNLDGCLGYTAHQVIDIGLTVLILPAMFASTLGTIAALGKKLWLKQTGKRELECFEILKDDNNDTVISYFSNLLSKLKDQSRSKYIRENGARFMRSSSSNNSNYRSENKIASLICKFFARQQRRRFKLLIIGNDGFFHSADSRLKLFFISIGLLLIGFVLGCNNFPLEITCVFFTGSVAIYLLGFYCAINQVSIYSAAHLFSCKQHRGWLFQVFCIFVIHALAVVYFSVIFIICFPDELVTAWFDLGFKVFEISITFLFGFIYLDHLLILNVKVAKLFNNTISAATFIVLQLKSYFLDCYFSSDIWYYCINIFLVPFFCMTTFGFILIFGKERWMEKCGMKDISYYD